MRLLESVVFGVSVTMLLGMVVYGFIVLTIALADITPTYPIIMFAGIVCTGCTLAYYFGRR